MTEEERTRAKKYLRLNFEIMILDEDNDDASSEYQKRCQDLIRFLKEVLKPTTGEEMMALSNFFDLAITEARNTTEFQIEMVHLMLDDQDFWSIFAPTK